MKANILKLNGMRAEPRDRIVELETCNLCGAVIMVSDPSAAQLHTAWHVAMENIRRRF